VVIQLHRVFKVPDGVIDAVFLLVQQRPIKRRRWVTAVQGGGPIARMRTPLADGRNLERLGLRKGLAQVAPQDGPLRFGGRGDEKIGSPLLERAAPDAAQTAPQPRGRKRRVEVN